MRAIARCGGLSVERKLKRSVCYWTLSSDKAERDGALLRFEARG